MKTKTKTVYVCGIPVNAPLPPDDHPAIIYAKQEMQLNDGEEIEGDEINLPDTNPYSDYSYAEMIGTFLFHLSDPSTINGKGKIGRNPNHNRDLAFVSKVYEYLIYMEFTNDPLIRLEDAILNVGNGVLAFLLSYAINGHWRYWHDLNAYWGNYHKTHVRKDLADVIDKLDQF